MKNRVKHLLLQFFLGKKKNTEKGGLIQEEKLGKKMRFVS